MILTTVASKNESDYPPKLSCGCRKLHDFVRQFGLRYASVDYLTEYLVNQVRNRHAHSIRRLSEAAHPFLVERIKRESIQAKLHDVRRGFHVFGPCYSFSECALKGSRKFSRQWGQLSALWGFSI